MKISQALDAQFYEQGFTDQTDLFHRRDLAERLTHLFANLEHGTVSILDGRWGTGKTVFARQWVHHLQQNGIGAIYFDAFASDYIVDPFQAVSAAFIRAATAAKKTHDKIYKRFLSNVARAARKMVPTAAKIGSKIVTFGVIGSTEIEQLKDVKDELTAAAGDLSEDAAKRILEEQAGSESTFEALRTSIAELPDLLAPKGAEEGSPSTLVIVIDELDRCRPDFALGVLETLKHFFRAERVHFVLVTNRDYLIRSVEKRYGLERDSAEYIQKYYDFVIHFETKSAHHRGSDAVLYAQRLLHQLLPSHVPQGERQRLEMCLNAVAIACDLTLRQIERIVTNVVMAYLAVADREFRPAEVVCFLATLKALEPNIYAPIKLGRFDFSAFVTWTNGWRWPDDFDIGLMRDWFEFFGSRTVNTQDTRFEHFGTGPSQMPRLEVLPYLANVVVDRFGKV